uniref:Uncharacterized protein n=1 Tax=Rhizophora mucronata TaxID=61149 RepID=A0A2P2J0P6_RHIMU
MEFSMESLSFLSL